MSCVSRSDCCPGCQCTSPYRELWAQQFGYLEGAEESFRVIISHLHDPVDRHRPHRGTKPADVLSRTPERPRTLRCNRQSDTEVFEVKLVVPFARDELVGTVSCEGADGCA